MTQSIQIEQTEQTPATSAQNNEEPTSEREFNWCPQEMQTTEVNATQCQQTLQKDDQDTSLTAEGVRSEPTVNGRTLLTTGHQANYTEHLQDEAGC